MVDDLAVVIQAPPSATRTTPVISEDAGLARNKQDSAISVLVPVLCSGIRDSI